MIHPYRVFVARGLVRESARRGIGPANFTGGDWPRFRVKKCEIELCDADTVERAREELEAIVSDGAADEELRDRAAMILDGVGPMATMEAYHWAQDWLSVIEKNNRFRPSIGDLINGPITAAADRPEVQAFLANRAVPTLTRMNHLYNIAVARMRLGDDAGAEADLNRVIDISEAETSADDVFRYVAESHRIGIWWRQAARSEDPEFKQEIYRRVCDYARERVETLIYWDDLRINLARWGWNAAAACGDMEAMAVFVPIAKSEPKIKLFED
jgi:hypothetical protein